MMTVDAVIKAAQAGYFAVVKQAMEDGMDVNADDPSGYTVLHGAAFGGSLELVRYLVEERGASLTVKDMRCNTVLHSAAEGGSLEVVKYLVKKKRVKVNAKNNAGQTPRDLAFLKKHILVANYFDLLPEDDDE